MRVFVVILEVHVSVLLLYFLFFFKFNTRVKDAPMACTPGDIVEVCLSIDRLIKSSYMPRALSSNA